MSTHPHSDQHDLDSTDELPRLDVAAYEARLEAESEDRFASTDTWATETQTTDETKRAEIAAFARFNRSARTQPEPPKTADVTLEATRILGRIGQLETELTQSTAQIDDLQRRLAEATNELADKDRSLRSLTAENARLVEQRTIVTTRLETLDQQLREESAQFERDLAQERNARAGEQSAAAKARTALEQQIAELTALTGRLRQENAGLEDETKAAAKLAKTQVELIEQFKQRLTTEEKNTAQLARHLAAKIAEHAGSAHEITRREATIATLKSALDETTAQLEIERATRAAAEQTLARSREQLAAAEFAVDGVRAELTARDQRIAELTERLQHTEASAAALTEARDAALRTLAAEREAQAQSQQILAARAQEIDQLHGSTESLQSHLTTLREQLAAAHSASQEQVAKLQELERSLSESQLRRNMLTSEVESSRHRLQQLETELKSALSSREALSTKASELQQSQEDLLVARNEIDELRATLVAKQAELGEREQAVRSAEEIVTDLRRINDELQQRQDDLQRRMSELETRDREREEHVLANAADLAAARRQVGQQLASVQSMEQAIRARDTLMERLRGELQTAQDERAIIAGQLQKSRARNQSMAREIFTRDSQIAALKADLAIHAETLAAIHQDVNRSATPANAVTDAADRILEPIDHDGDIIILNKKVMTIGRTSENDVCIPSKLVSRNHARLLVGPNAVIVEDAGSTNGCFVNDVQVKQQLMREGDVLSIGDLKYRLRTRPENATRTRDNVIPFSPETRDDE